MDKAITAAAIVKTKAEGEGGYTVELDIATFRSQYPTKITRVPAPLAAQLKVGKAVNVNLVRQALKKRADGTTRSGEYYSDYYWGLESIAAHDAPTLEPETDTTAHRDLRDESIKSQVAVKEIGSCLCAKVDVPPSLINRYWQIVAEWLSFAETPDPPVTGQKRPAEAAPIKQEATKTEAPLFWPHLETLGQFQGRCHANGLTVADTYAILGVKTVKEIKQEPDEAWLIIAQKKGFTPETAKL